MPIIAGQITGSILSGSLSYTFLSNIPLGIVSGAAQVQPLLPGGTVTSSAQYPGWVTASSQIDYNSITNKLSGVVSSSTQIKPLLPDGTVSSSVQVDYNSITNKLSGVYSSSAFTTVNQGTLRLSFNGVALSDVDTGLQTTDGPTFAGMVSTAIVSGSGASYRLVVPVGTNYYAT